MTDAHLTNDELKKLLRQTAEERNIDLSDPENRFTLWTRHGWWGHLFWGSASYPSRIHGLLGYYMFPEAVILEVNESGDVVRRFSCDMG
jgi:hypothetical protein